MTIIQTILTALSTGATLALETTAGQTIKDAYAALKSYVQTKYAGLHLKELEADPASPAWRAVLQEELTKANAATDAQLLQQVLDTIATQPPTTVVIGVDLAAIKGASLNLRNIVAEGGGSVTGSVTGVKIRGGVFVGPVKISGVAARQGGQVPTPAPTPTPAPIKILFLAANPLDTPLLRIDEEARAIDRALRSSELRNFVIHSHWAVRVEDLQELLLRHQPQIVHFSGHGTEQHEIILQDERGVGRGVSAGALQGLFRLFNDTLRCVVLNACFAAAQATAISAVVDCVVGMQAEATDQASLAFATAFYRGLGYGQSVQQSFDLGCNALNLHQLATAAQPQLIATRVDPAAVYFAKRNADLADNCG